MGSGVWYSGTTAPMGGSRERVDLELKLAAVAVAILASYPTTSYDVLVSLLHTISVVEWAKLSLALLSTAAAIVLGLQAVLHTKNLPTLMMIQAAAYCVETAILTWLGYKLRSRIETARISIATLCCAGILLFEYRLEVPVLETALPAVILSGIARVSWWSASRSSPEMASIVQHADALVCAVASFITVAFIAIRGDETVGRFMFAMDSGHLPLLAMNLLATAIAVRIGRSVLVPIANTQVDIAYNGNDDRIENVLILAAMTAATGLVSVLKLRRSYTSWPQYLFFAIVAALLSSGNLATQYGHKWMARYDYVPNDLPLSRVDSEDTIVSVSDRSDDTDDTHVEPVPDRRNTILRILFVAVVLPSLWIPYMTYNFSDTIHQTAVEAQPILDSTYVPQTKIEFVISMYKEPVDEVARMISKLKNMPNLRDPLIHIYTKDDNPNIQRIIHGTGAHKVTPLANIGREGETYLYHILNSWDTLAQHTVFLQADVHNPREFYPRIRNYFDPERTGMLSLGWAGHVCNMENCGDRYNLWDTTHLFPEIAKRVNNGTSGDQMLLSYKGQFIASAKRIRGVDKSVYQDLHNAFNNTNSWAHREPFLEGRPDSLSAPQFGFTVERIWNLLLQCNSMRVAWKCPSLISGNRIGGNVEDCQCFDPISDPVS